MLYPRTKPHSLEKLLSGEANAAWIEAESQRLLNLMDTVAGVTLPDGGAVIDDLYGPYPDLGRRPRVQMFSLPNLTQRGFLPAAQWQKG